MGGRISRLVAVVAIVLVWAVAFFSLNQLSNTEATSFNPTSSLEIDDTGAGANPAHTTDLVIPAPDANFATSGAGFISFFPNDWCFATHLKDCSATSGPTPTGTHPQSGGVPTGTVVGTLESSTTLAIQSVPPGTSINNTCNGNFVVAFTFLDAVTNDSSGSNVINTGTGEDIFLPLSQETGTTGLPKHVTAYPGYLNTLFDPDGPGGDPTVEPLARYSGDTIVAGTTVILQFLIFAPGDLQNFEGQPFQSMTSARGYPTVTVLQDPQQANNGTIGDFCTSLSTETIILGISTANNTPCGECGANDPMIDGGSVLHKNGTLSQGIGDTGTFLYRATTQAQRDVDNDGHENAMDTCPFTTNTDGDPRTTNGPDNDALDSACDPASMTENRDQDDDGWANRIDDCPLVSQADNAHGINDVPPGTLGGVPDGGPPSDGIGEACEASTADETISNGHYHEENIKDFVCNGGTDSDGDGWCDDREDAGGTGSGENKACANDSTPNNETVDGLATDFNDDQLVNTGDRALIVNAIINTPTAARFDLNGNGGVDNKDRAAVVISIGFDCS